MKNEMQNSIVDELFRLEFAAVQIEVFFDHPDYAHAAPDTIQRSKGDTLRGG